MDVSTKQKRIAELSKRKPEMRMTTLNHYLDIEWMREAYRRIRKDSAPGIDGLTVEAYGKELEKNLTSLMNRAKSGEYFAPPVKRKYIPKGTGTETRPIGMPTTEDKILQRAIVMLLEPIYEEDFYDFSCGFRPNRSAFQALEYLWEQAMGNNIRCLLDVDIRKYFDTLDKSKLQEIIRQRVEDGVVNRLIGKWLNAGVMEGGRVEYMKTGTPQGGVISPLLSNIYLHEVLDKWFVKIVKVRLKGRAFLVRFADDFVMGFEFQDDAEKVLEVLHKRFNKYGLKLHPDKTRLVSFESPTKGKPYGKRNKPGTFNFLGFTHYWGISKKGNWIVKRKTARDRFVRGLKRINDWCRKNRHEPVKLQWKTLCQKLQGHFAYYGITGNAKYLEKYKDEVRKTWRKWLNRRSRNPNGMSWNRFNEMILHIFPFPIARVVHSVFSVKP